MNKLNITEGFFITKNKTKIHLMYKFSFIYKMTLLLFYGAGHLSGVSWRRVARLVPVDPLQDAGLVLQLDARPDRYDRHQVTAH